MGHVRHVRTPPAAEMDPGVVESRTGRQGGDPLVLNVSWEEW